MKAIVEKYTINFVKRNTFEGIDIDIPNSVKSTTISKILAGVTAPMIYLEEKKDSYFVLSYSSVIATILDFVRGNFKLESNFVMDKLLNKKFENKTFFDFSDEEKGLFFEQSIAVTIFRDLNDLEREVLQGEYLVNQPKTEEKPKVSEKRNVNVKVPIKTNIDKELETYLKNSFFTKVNVPVVSNDIVLQLLMISDEGAQVEFSSKKIIQFKESLDSVPDISETLNYLDNAYEEKCMYLKKAHIPMIYVCAEKAIKHNMEPKQFKKLIDNFFLLEDKEYKEASIAHTTLRANVNTRTRVMLDYFMKNV